MTSAVPLAHEDLTIGQLHDLLAKSSKDYKTINYIYVLDTHGHLIGVLSVRDIFDFKKAERVGSACKKSPLLYVHPETHQERAAYLALRHNIKAIPVVGRDMKFLGEITADSILSILYKEMHEDSLRRAGIGHAAGMGANVLSMSVFTSLRHRLPWLIVGLAGGLLMAHIIGFFEQTLSQNIALAAFIPLVVYMSSAVGTQMETYVIRDLALEKHVKFWKYLWKNVAIVLVIALALSALLMLAYRLFYPDAHVGTVIGLAMFASICSSVVTGIVIPFTFGKMSLDPADASGPVATIVQDGLSVLIYFGIATILL